MDEMTLNGSDRYRAAEDEVAKLTRRIVALEGLLRECRAPLIDIATLPDAYRWPNLTTATQAQDIINRVAALGVFDAALTPGGGK